MHRSRKITGLTLIELLVSLAIIAILATMALPVATNAVQRQREVALRSTLRDVRTAIDRFHDDWLAGHVSHMDPGVSENGLPKSLSILVQGVDTGTPNQPKRRYLRQVPRDPLAERSGTAEESWTLRSYADEPDTAHWGGQDVYDIHSSSRQKALDGSLYKDW